MCGPGASSNLKKLFKNNQGDLHPPQLKQVGGFKYFLFSPRKLGMDDSLFDYRNIFQMVLVKNHQLEKDEKNVGIWGLLCLVT